jgi:hypothetical protein
VEEIRRKAATAALPGLATSLSRQLLLASCRYRVGRLVTFLPSEGVGLASLYSRRAEDLEGLLGGAAASSSDGERRILDSRRLLGWVMLWIHLGLSEERRYPSALRDQLLCTSGVGTAPSNIQPRHQPERRQSSAVTPMAFLMPRRSLPTLLMKSIN